MVYQAKILIEMITAEGLSQKVIVSISLGVQFVAAPEFKGSSANCAWLSYLHSINLMSVSVGK